MSGCYYSENATNSGPQGPHWGPPGSWSAGPWSGRHWGPPLPVKILAVALAFLLFKPLGIVLTIVFVAKALMHQRGAMGPDFARWARGPRPTGNSALDERRRETLDRLAEEEKAFTEFEEKQRQARDKEAFDRFIAERNAGGDSAPKA